jgi:hypothetical protein
VGFAAKQNPHRPDSARVLVLRARRVTAFIVTKAGVLMQKGFFGVSNRVVPGTPEAGTSVGAFRGLNSTAKLQSRSMGLVD